MFPYVLPCSIHPYLIFDVWNTIPLKTIPIYPTGLRFSIVPIHSGWSNLIGLLPIFFQLSALVCGLPELEFVKVLKPCSKNTYIIFNYVTISHFVEAQELANWTVPPESYVNLKQRQKAPIEGGFLGLSGGRNVVLWEDKVRAEVLGLNGDQERLSRGQKTVYWLKWWLVTFRCNIGSGDIYYTWWS